ncbi:uncharacterized protein LOC115626504 [Scaptodrosophila lebanonensis]|uniref:Uncharacterized protein LOC115626504 n=1 Tax=Drosophila lebanonensis TaxID=7225 RepID=A0A6J2TNX4_DROLE|nr:uncharacterized protein LOC115626504 [Scaptodrosophila lebanonensis]
MSHQGVKMLNKVFFITAFLAYYGLQQVDALDCYKCTSILDCRAPHLVTCSNAEANETSVFLGRYHNHVPTVNQSSYFKCISLNYTSITTDEWKGCAHPQAYACSLMLNNANYVRTCSTCNTNKCNGSGSSSSSFYSILVGTLLALILAKFY